MYNLIRKLRWIKASAKCINVNVKTISIEKGAALTLEEIQALFGRFSNRRLHPP